MSAADGAAACYSDAMIIKHLGVAALFFTVALTAAAQANNSSAHPATTSSPAATQPASQAAPAARNDCQGGSCDAPTPHITIATPAPAPAPWLWQDRIAWAANLILVLIAYGAIMLAISLLRKIEHQARLSEAAAQAAAESAKAALLLAEAQQRAERPWIVVAPEAVPGAADSFNVVAVNRGHSPARIVSLAGDLAIATDESKLPAELTFNSEPQIPRPPVILLPGESVNLRTFSRSEVKTLCASADDLHRVEEWETKIYLYGAVAYSDLRTPADAEPLKTTWCCWYIHGRQKSGMVMAGTASYRLHT